METFTTVATAGNVTTTKSLLTTANATLTVLYTAYADSLHGNVSASAYEQPLRTAFISVFTVTAFVGNLLLILAISQNKSLRQTSVNVHVVSMSVANFLFCAINMPLMIAYSVTETWDYGATMCSLFTYIGLTTSIEYVLGLLCLSIDRLVVARRPSHYHSTMMTAKSCAAAVICWLIALGTPVPILTGTVPTTMFGDRFSCGLSLYSSVDFPASVYVCLFAVPSLLTCLVLMMTACTIMKEWDSPSRGRGLQSFDGASDVPSARNTQQVDQREAKGAVFVLILFVLWILLAAPYVALTSIELYYQSSHNLPGVMVLYSYSLELVFTWLSCSHQMILPFATFFWRKDVWLKFKEIMSRRKSNLVVDVASSRRQQPPTEAAAQPQQVDRFPTAFKVPVLVATGSGLHVQHDENEAYDPQVFYADFTTRSADLQVERRGVRRRATSGGSNDSNVRDAPIGAEAASESGESSSSQLRLLQNDNFGGAAGSSGQVNSLSTDSGVSSSTGSSQKLRKSRARPSAFLVPPSGIPIGVSSSDSTVPPNCDPVAPPSSALLVRSRSSQMTAPAGSSDNSRHLLRNDGISFGLPLDISAHFGNFEKRLDASISIVTDADAGSKLTDQTHQKKRHKKRKKPLQEVETVAATELQIMQPDQNYNDIERVHRPLRLKPIDQALFESIKESSPARMYCKSLPGKGGD